MIEGSTSPVFPTVHLRFALLPSWTSRFSPWVSPLILSGVSDKVNHSDKNDELKQLGYINDYNGDANRVYDGETIARALKAEAGGGGAKTGWYALRSPEVDHGESQN